MTPEEEKLRCLSKGILEAIEVPIVVRLPPHFSVAVRIISEGQYQAMKEVRLASGKKVLPK